MALEPMASGAIRAGDGRPLTAAAVDELHEFAWNAVQTARNVKDDEQLRGLRTWLVSRGEELGLAGPTTVPRDAVDSDESQSTRLPVSDPAPASGQPPTSIDVNGPADPEAT